MSASQGVDTGGLQRIGIDTLPVQQLDQIKKDVDQEINVMNETINQLKIAQRRLSESSDNLDHVISTNEGKQLMVPMTSSLYVPGYLDDTSSILVDIGTGYFVEKSLHESREYFKRKVDYITEQMEKIHPLIVEKQNIRGVVVEALNNKLAQQMKAMDTNDTKAS